MLNAIKRVISGGDMVEELASQNDEAPEEGPDDVGMNLDDDGEPINLPTTPTTTTAGIVPVLVENDMDMMETCDYHISISETPRSSLSDVSAAQRLSSAPDETMREVQARIPNQVGTTDQSSKEVLLRKGMMRNAPGQQTVEDWNNLGRIDSRMMDRSSDESSSIGKPGSSQNSSRDWGWFEDVHTPEGVLHPSTESPARGASKRSTKESSSSSSHSKRKSTKSFPRISLIPPVADNLRTESLQPIAPHDPESAAAAMAVTAPTYVLEESLSSQKLWKDTAGTRPPQPLEERAFFEKMWAQNFAKSQVDYQMPVEVLTATTPISLSPFADGNFDTRGGANEMSNYNLAIPPSGGDESGTADVAEAALMRNLHDPAQGQKALTASVISGSHNSELLKRTVKTTTSDGDTLTVSTRGDNVFGTTVSKSFARPSDYGGPITGVDTVNISIASYRVVESKKHGKYAQFLVIYREGSIRDTVGVWKRYSDFQNLSKKVTQAHEGCAAVIANMSPLAVTEEHEVEHLPNAITSWRLLKKRQRWYRCLDAGYLSLKVFLLERFLHDILFESSSPNLLRDFVIASEQGSP